MRKASLSKFPGGPCFFLVFFYFFFGPATPWLHAVDPLDFSETARTFQQHLTEHVFPYWFDTAQDGEQGGYLLADGLQGRGTAQEKQLVTQSRMIWGFAHAHRHGYSTERRNYLSAAEQGYRFLKEHFHDRDRGGYFWSTDLEGKPLNHRKLIYGQAFVIYGLVELHRANGNTAVLEDAMQLYRVLQEKVHDDERGGWMEHFEADWTPILAPESGAWVEVPGYKSANTHLHLMEAFTELYETSGNADVRGSLEEALRLNKTYFYPRRPEASSFHRQLDWKPVTDPSSAGLSYGHNVEFAWLMIRAEKVLGMDPSWPHFYAHLNHALKYGFDDERGGLMDRGFGDEPATDTDKIWWVQSEMLAACTDALDHRKSPRIRKALDLLLDFLFTYQIDPEDKIWLETISLEGEVKSGAKAHNWKANYHDVRAMIKFIEVFG